MKINDDLKEVVLSFCEKRRVELSLNAHLYNRFCEIAFNVCLKVMNEDFSKVSMIDSLIGLDIWHFIVIEKDLSIYSDFGSCIGNIFSNTTVITQDQVIECVELGFSFQDESDAYYYGDNNYWEELYWDGEVEEYYWIKYEK